MIDLFLDMDGVLNSETFMRRLEERHRLSCRDETTRLRKRDTTCRCFGLEKLVDDEAVVRLNRLLAASGAKVVISSSWRKIVDPPQLLVILRSHGFQGEIIGETPDGNDPSLLAEFEYLDRIFRGHEIDLWLRRHPEVTHFAILDDDGDMVMHKNRLVQTDAEDGLLDDHVEWALKILAWDGTGQHPFAAAG